MRSIQIQLTSNCNSRCYFCRKYTWPSKQISLVKLREKLEKYPDATITFSGGDPLAYSNLQQLNNLLKGRTYQIFTNLTYDMTLDRLRFIKNAECIQVSYDANERALYREIRGVDKYFKLIHNIKIVQTFCNTVIKLNCVINRKNYKLIGEIAKQTYDLFHVVTRFYMVHTNEELTPQMLGFAKIIVEKLKKARPEVYDNSYFSFEDEDIVLCDTCNIKLHHRLIDEDGREYTCCHAINDTGKDWDGKYETKNLEGIEDPKVLYPYCDTCARYARFNTAWDKYKDKRFF